MQAGSVAKAMLLTQGGNRRRPPGDLDGAPALRHEQHFRGIDITDLRQQVEDLRQIVPVFNDEFELVLREAPEETSQRFTVTSQLPVPPAKVVVWIGVGGLW